MDIRHAVSPRRPSPRIPSWIGSRVGSVLALSALAALSATGAGAQESDDVHLADIHETERGPALRAVRNLTRRQGYDNQPAFSPDGNTLFYTSQRGDGDALQTDIWQIDLTRDPLHPRALFESPTSEYSPTPVPGADALSVIRVEEDGKQKLWRLPLDGAAPRRVLDQVEPVGYHAWAGTELVLFVLAEPHQLQRVSGAVPSNLGRVVAADIGRALHKIPGRDAFSFVHKTEEGWWIKSLEVEGDRLAKLVRTRGEREDFAWAPDGSLWTSDGETFFRFRPGVDDDWRPVELTGPSPRGITRLTVSPDGRRLAFVAEASPGPALEGAAAEATGAETTENDGET